MDLHGGSEGGAPGPTAPPAGGGLRLLAVAVTLPWLLAYGVTGGWAVTRGARAAAAGLASLDVGYSRPVTPGGVLLVGGLLLAAFAVVLAAALLLLFDARGAGRWAAVAAVAAALSAGSVWAAARGGLGPGLWLLFFFGLLWALVLAAVRLATAAGRARRGTAA